MPATIVALADLHISTTLRWAETKRVLAWTLTDLEARARAGDVPHLIIVVGDIYHTPPRPEEVMVAVRFISGLAGIAPVVVLRGNHDPKYAIDVFACLDTPHPITIYEEPTVHHFPQGGVVVLPWLDHVGPPPDRRMSQQERALARGEAISTMIDKLAAEIGAVDGVRIVAAHCTIVGAKTSTGQPLRKGTEFDLALHELERLNADAYVLGHVHLGQAWYLGNAPVIYAGSTIATAFGEIEEKRYLRIEIGEDRRSKIDVVVTPTSPMVLIDTKWLGGGFEMDLDDLRSTVASACARAPVGTTAEVRFRYHVTHEHREAARLAARGIVAELERLGARVKPEPMLETNKVARCPEIARTASLADKLDLYLSKVREIAPGDARAAAAREALAELEQALSIRRLATGGSRLRRLRFAGLGIFTEETTIDLDDASGTVLAVWGDNGHGKSTMLSAWPAAVYRKIPTDHGLISLAKYVTRTDGFLEATIDLDGTDVRLFHNFADDKSYVYLNGDEAVDPRGMKGTFDRWVAENLLPREVFTSAFFAVQADDGIIRAKRAERKKLLLQAFDAGVLTRVGAAASARATKETKTLDKLAFARAAKAENAAKHPSDLDAQRIEAVADGVRYDAELAAAHVAESAYQAALAVKREADALGAEVVVAQQRLARLMGQRHDLMATIADAATIRAAEHRLQELESELVTARRAETAYQAALAIRRDADTLRAAVGLAEQRVARLNGQRNVLVATLADAPAIHAAEQHVLDFDAEIRSMESALQAMLDQAARADEAERVALKDAHAAASRAAAARSGATARARRAEDAERAALKDAHAAAARAQQARAAAARARAAQAERPIVDDAVARLPALVTALELAEATATAAEEMVVDLRKMATTASTDRIQGLRGAHDHVVTSETLLVAHQIAGAALGLDDDLARKTSRDSLEAAERDARARRAQANEARAHLQQAREVAARASLLDRAAEDEATATRTATEEEANVTAAHARASEIAHAAAEDAATTERSAAEEDALVHAAHARASEIARGAADDRARAHLMRPNITALKSERASAGQVAARAPALARAEGALKALDIEITQAIEEVDAAKLRADSIQLQELPVRPDVDGLERTRADVGRVAARAPALTRAEGGLVALDAEIVKATEDVAQATARAARVPIPELPPRPDVAAADQRSRSVLSRLARIDAQIDALRAMQAEIAADDLKLGEQRAIVGTWELLTEAFGPEGIPALEIDATCPLLSELATGYLHRHFGPRWSISVDTTVADDDGEDADVLNITVSDAENGRSQDILFFSPGERAPLGRAFSAALAYVICARTGAPTPTLVLDETAGALSPSNLAPYMAMIRGVAEDIGASKVLLVVHSPALAALADSLIRVDRGSISVEHPVPHIL